MRNGQSPAAISAVRAWYRLAASTPVSSEWETVVDVLGGASLVQTDADRKLAVGAAANGLPTGTYDGSDCMRMPLGANNFSTSKYGLSFWWTPNSIGSTQNLFAIVSPDASVNVLTFRVNSSGVLALTVYIATNADGRVYTTAGTVSNGAMVYPRVQIDMTRTAECDLDGLTTDAKVRVFINEVAQAMVATDLGAGGALTTLRTPVGAAVVGALTDADAPGTPLRNGNIHGPNTFILLDTPTPAQGLALMNFERPT